MVRTGAIRYHQTVHRGFGFGFTWSAGFPVARIDQILVRHALPERSWVLPAVARHAEGAVPDHSGTAPPSTTLTSRDDRI